MFKASIVEDKEYYRIRAKMILVGSIFFPIFWSLMFIKTPPLWLVLIVGTGTAIEFYYSRKLVKLSLSLFGKRKIILDLNNIQIIGQNKKVQREYIPSVLDNITIHSDFQFYQESVVDLYRNKHHMNCVIIRDGNSEETFYFEFDSHYMIVQLKKIIKHWKTQNLNLTTSELSEDLNLDLQEIAGIKT